MSPIKSQHSKVLERLIGEFRETLVSSLTEGVPADYPAYRQIVGQLEGLTNALRLSEQADYELSGEA